MNVRPATELEIMQALACAKEVWEPAAIVNPYAIRGDRLHGITGIGPTSDPSVGRVWAVLFDVESLGLALTRLAQKHLRLFAGYYRFGALVTMTCTAEQLRWISLLGFEPIGPEYFRLGRAWRDSKWVV